MNKNLLILGGCGGIGRAVVAEALKRDYTLTVLDLPRSIEHHPLPENVSIIPVDATSETSLSTARSQVESQTGPIDGFVNLCGFMHELTPLVDTPTSVWDELIEGNLTSSYLSARCFAPMIRAGGSMVLASSGLGSVARPGYGPYAVSKAGIIMMTKLLATELAPDIRVNCVAPGAVDTGFLRGGTGRSDEKQTLRFDIEGMSSITPLGRIAQGDDVAGPILFFLSEDAKYVTGQTLHINGGSYMP
jgi:NAD(P)-dependent dehydrogenase (short-subunit alcohol dehydrogenase family)